MLKDAKGLTGDEALSKYQEAEKLAVADLPAVPLWYGDTTAGWSESVDNVKFTPFSRVAVTEIEKN